MSALGWDHRKPPTGANAAHDDLDAQAVGETIEKSLCVARELLSMDIAWIAEFRDGKKVVRIVDRDAPSFGFSAGDALPLDRSYSQRFAQGTVANVIGDTGSEPEICDLDAAASAGIGSYVGVPIELVDGTVYGTLCVASHRPGDELTERDAAFLRGVARRAVADLEAMRISAVDG